MATEPDVELSYSEREFKQANHLWECAEKIREMKDFDDWYVVTVFYASLHYCRALLFHRTATPIHSEHELNGCETFEEYCTTVNPGGYVDRHSTLVDLVRRHHSKIAPGYRMLKSSANKSRYQTFDLSPEEVSKAYGNALSIRSYAKNYLEAKP